MSELLRRPEVDWERLGTIRSDRPTVHPVVSEQVVTDIKYAGYLKRESARAAQTRRLEAVELPKDMDFHQPGISTEVAERLDAARPATLGAAARLPGITPAAIDVLAVQLARRLAQ